VAILFKIFKVQDIYFDLAIQQKIFETRTVEFT